MLPLKIQHINNLNVQMNISLSPAIITSGRKWLLPHAAYWGLMILTGPLTPFQHLVRNPICQRCKMVVNVLREPSDFSFYMLSVRSASPLFYPCSFKERLTDIEAKTNGSETWRLTCLNHARYTLLIPSSFLCQLTHSCLLSVSVLFTVESILVPFLRYNLQLMFCFIPGWLVN